MPVASLEMWLGVISLCWLGNSKSFPTSTNSVNFEVSLLLLTAEVVNIHQLHHNADGDDGARGAAMLLLH